MDPRDEARLNDWIEGVATAADAAAVQAMLARDPALAARVDAMRSDRERMLGLPAPTVPAELRAAIDDRVARILLLAAPVGDDAPGLADGAHATHAAHGGNGQVDAFQGPASLSLAGTDTADWRARRRQRTVVRRWTVGAAAGLAAAATITVVLVLQGTVPGGEPREDVEDLLASNAGAGVTTPPNQSASGPVAEPFRPEAGAVVVHGLPLPTVAPAPLARAGDPVVIVDRLPADTEDPASAPVAALRIAGLDRAALEARLVAIAEAAGDADGTLDAAGPRHGGGEPTKVAVTRNLTTDALASMMPRQAGRADEPLWADLRSGRDVRDAGWRQRVDERLDRVIGRTGRTGGDGSASDGTVIAGAAQQRPGWGEQIVFAESGAAWTLSVPAGEAPAVLARLERALGAEVRSGLVTLDAVRWRIDDDTAAWRTARDVLRRMADDHPDRLVHIPIVLDAR